MTPARVPRREQRGAGRPEDNYRLPGPQEIAPPFRAGRGSRTEKPPARAGLDTARAGPEREMTITE